MELLESAVVGETFVLVFGTITLLIVVIMLITFAFLFQRKLSRKQAEFQRIEILLKDQEVKSSYAILEAQELERKRISEDLHDRLGSRLAAVKLHFQAFENSANNNPIFFKKGSELLDGAVDEVREISHNLASGLLSKFGLTAALQDLKQTLESSQQIVVQLHIHNIDNRLNLLVESNIYRIVQELVSNILKHAKATEIVIQLNKFEDDLIIIVEDNGNGFDSNTTRNKPGIGLSNVESRVKKLDGNFRLDSNLGKGTVITIEIPAPND